MQMDSCRSLAAVSPRFGLARRFGLDPRSYLMKIAQSLRIRSQISCIQ